MWHSMWNWDGSWGIAWGWFALMHVLWWGLVAAGLVAVYRSLADRGRPDAGAPDRSLDILRERFARGEIDRAEFDDRKQVLKG